MKFSFRELEEKFDNLSYEQERKLKISILSIAIAILLFSYILYQKYVFPLEEERKIENLKNIKFLLEQEGNKNKDLILKKLKSKDNEFLKEYYEKKLLGI